MKHQKLPRIGITAGCPSGVGPEVVVQSLRDRRLSRGFTPVVFGDRSLERHLPSQCLVPVTRLSKNDRRPGHPTHATGLAQWEYLDAALRALKSGTLDALCTAPVAKAQISAVGIPFSGHTEWLSSAFQCPVIMVMEGPRMRVAVATGHIPLKAVAAQLTTEKLLDQLTLLNQGYRRRWGRKPRVGVLGLNPHAGEQGLLGQEEATVIAPAVNRAKSKGVLCEGPLPADGAFADAACRRSPFDVLLAMFHDQGLCAAKAMDFSETVNVTLGLPFPRTSPDHGVAYALAGKGIADATPMKWALAKAVALVKNPRRA